MLTGRIVDSYTNILTVKLFAHTDREDAYARFALQEQMDRWRASLRLITGMEMVLYSLNGMLIVGASGLAIKLWETGNVSVGAIAVVIGLVIRIVTMSGWVMWTAIGIFDNIGIVQAGMRTIARPHGLVDRSGAEKLVATRGAIRFENVRFHYGKKGGVIDNLSFSIAPGEKVGLVGRSGAGKTTIASLLLRFHDVEAGRVLIDGQDVGNAPFVKGPLGRLGFRNPFLHVLNAVGVAGMIGQDFREMLPPGGPLHSFPEMNRLRRVVAREGHQEQANALCSRSGGVGSRA